MFSPLSWKISNYVLYLLKHSKHRGFILGVRLLQYLVCLLVFLMSIISAGFSYNIFLVCLVMFQLSARRFIYKTVCRNCWNLRWRTPLESIHFASARHLWALTILDYPRPFQRFWLAEGELQTPWCLSISALLLFMVYPFVVPTKVMISLGFSPLCPYLALGSNLHALSHGRLSVAQFHISFVI